MNQIGTCRKADPYNCLGVPHSCRGGAAPGAPPQPPFGSPFRQVRTRTLACGEILSAVSDACDTGIAVVPIGTVPGYFLQSFMSDPTGLAQHL